MVVRKHIRIGLDRPVNSETKAENMFTCVTELLRSRHEEMLKSLRAGKWDSMLERQFFIAQQPR